MNEFLTNISSIKLYDKETGEEINFGTKLLTSKELDGMLNQPEDEGNYTLDLKEVREERAEVILNKEV